MKMIQDGCTAATYVAYAMSDVATIYPITPIASMGETADRWNLQGRLNVFGSTMKVKEMESELGAAGATHGALAGGALATTFTSSQGLLLMIPNMFKISGELLPAVFHVGTRSIATQALSIFGDHQDVMACRSTGFAMLASASVQETMDLALAAHLSAIKSRVPVLHFFDGWRTSNQLSTIDTIPYDTMSKMVDMDAVSAFRSRAMNPLHPDLRGSAQNPDVYFQNREAANKYYDAFPDILSGVLDDIAKATGRRYKLFDYYGDPQAEQVAVVIGSGAEPLREASDRLNASGMKTGVLSVRLYRPFRADKFIEAIPKTAKCIVALDRSKEPGAQGEPLFLDTIAAVHEAGLSAKVIGGRYGLSSKEFNPHMAEAVFANAASDTPKKRFTVGIEDDVTGLSLQVPDSKVYDHQDVRQCIFYGMGSDGTVGATRMAAGILSDTLGKYAQVYFHYSAKKSGGYTMGELRYGDAPISAEYGIEEADYIGCNKDTYVRRFDLSAALKPGGTFVLNSTWTDDELSEKLPVRLKADLAKKHAVFYNINATKIAADNNLGVRINIIMETVFLHLSDDVDTGTAIKALKDRVAKSYIHEGQKVVDNNIKAIDMTIEAIKRVDIPAAWAEVKDEESKPVLPQNASATMRFVDTIARACMSLEGDKLPVSVFSPDGVLPLGTTAWEKRRIAINVPQWNPDKCIECTQCSLVCPHAAIRPVLATDQELKDAPSAFVTKQCRYANHTDLHYRIQVYTADCTGCGSCAVICPGHALDMKPIATQIDVQEPLRVFSETIPEKEGLLPLSTVQGTQMMRPLLQFSGACAGCGETPYVKLLTQMFGKRMTIANATGCSSIWGANYPSIAYCADRNGCGPAWGNSLFEDNAEYGFGIATAYHHRREALKNAAQSMLSDASVSENVKSALTAWVGAFDDASKSQSAGEELVKALSAIPDNSAACEIIEGSDMLGKKSVWVIGGDGWAYDIGFAGLDHVLAQDMDINILVMDTECYSNTGGQTSKATPLGAAIGYAAHGKRTIKKDLGRMMMTYGNVYVAQVALGANYMQTIKALSEAESYPGPSIVIAYCPCIEHGIRTGMSHSIVEEKTAVKTGYWDIYRYDPRLVVQGKSPLTVDAPAPDTALDTMLDNENRYASLKLIDPAAVSPLRKALSDREVKVRDILDGLSKTGDC